MKLLQIVLMYGSLLVAAFVLAWVIFFPNWPRRRRLPPSPYEQEKRDERLEEYAQRHRLD
jgi:hypothetical protein